MLLNEKDLKDSVLKDILELEAARENIRHKKNEAIDMRIFMDSVRDHLVPIIANQDSAKNMYDALRNLFENENHSKILALKDQLRQVKFKKDDFISTYFMKIAQIKDQLATVEESIPNRDLVLTTMGGLPSEWSPYVKGTCARGQMPSFDQFWSECIPRRNKGDYLFLERKGRRNGPCSQHWKEEREAELGQKRLRA